MIAGNCPFGDICSTHSSYCSGWMSFLGNEVKIECFWFLSPYQYVSFARFAITVIATTNAATAGQSLSHGGGDDRHNNSWWSSRGHLYLGHTLPQKYPHAIASRAPPQHANISSSTISGISIEILLEYLNVVTVRSHYCCDAKTVMVSFISFLIIIIITEP